MPSTTNSDFEEGLAALVAQFHTRFGMDVWIDESDGYSTSLYIDGLCIVYQDTRERVLAALTNIYDIGTGEK